MIRLATIESIYYRLADEGILELDEIQLTAVYSRNLEKGKQFAAKYNVEKMITTKRWQKIQRLMRFM